MRILKAFMNSIDVINERLGRLGSIIILAIILIGSIEVILRFVFRSPTNWSWELNSMLLCFYVGLAGGYTTLIDGHVRVDIFYEKCSLRQKAIIDLLLSFLFFTYVGIALWFLSKLAWNSFADKEHLISTWAAPVYPVKIFLVLAVILVLLQGLVKFIRDLRVVITGRNHEH